jgi:hypothetical protein
MSCAPQAVLFFAPIIPLRRIQRAKKVLRIPVLLALLATPPLARG